MMIYATYTDGRSEETRGGLFYSFEDFHRATFSPSAVVVSVVEFSTLGKTYAEKKESARVCAAAFQAAEVPGLTWLDFATVGAYFEKVGRRFGLLREFRNNGLL